MPRLAFLGPRATFTEQALLTLPEARDAELVPCAGTPAVLAAIRDGRADAGCVPIENSVEGAVPPVLDGLLDDPPLMIVKEVVLPVRFAVMVRPGSGAADVRTVASHNHGIAQTRNWIARHLPDAEVLVSTSTSESAAQVARGEVDAAVAAPLAAREFGLEILADDVADNAGAVTRFVLLTPPGPPPAPTGRDRTTLAATTENRPGSLLGLLTELAVRGIDLTRIESRPIKHRHAEYWFHLDCSGHIADPAMGEALAALHRRCDQVRFLGSYPRAAGTNGAGTNGTGLGVGAPAVPEHGSDADAFAAAQRWLDALRSGERGVSRAVPTGQGAGVRLVLVRHGRSTANAAHVLDSRLPGAPLDDTGRAQARRLAERLADWPIRAVYASRAPRAQDTAAPTAAALGLPVRVVDGVHEVSIGDLEGRSDTAAFGLFEKAYTAWWRGDLDARMPGGESALDVRSRFLPALDALVAPVTEGDVLLVSHGAAIRMAAAALLGETVETFYVPNGGLVVLRRGGGAGWVLESWDRADPVPGDVTAGGAPY